MFSNNFQNNHNNYNNNFRAHSAPQRFPSQPRNIQPKFVQRHYPTSAQVFGFPKNVFKLTGQKPTNEPEPMSTTSRNPTIRQSIRNRFQPSGPRNFISKEPHQIDEEPYKNQINNEPQSNEYQSNTNHYYYNTDSPESNYFPNHSNAYDNFDSEENVKFQIPGPSSNPT